MNSYTKEFLHRGLIFGGFGPIITGIIFCFIAQIGTEVILTGPQIFLAIISTYLLAFIHAGASIFNQIEHWPIAKSILCHFLTLYVAYSLCYIANTWIPFEPMVIAIFTAVFAIVYFVIWLTVYLIVKGTAKKLNANLK